MSYVYGLGAFRPIERLRWSLITPDDVSVVRCLRSIVIPGNETCFYVFEAPSAEAVREGSRRAAIGFERIVPVIQVEPVVKHPPAGARRGVRDQAGIRGTTLRVQEQLLHAP
jgi:hypothetical protein